MKKNYYLALWADGIQEPGNSHEKNEYSEAAEAYEYFHGLIDQRNIYVIVAENRLEQARVALPMLSAANFITEPAQRNSAVSFAYIAFKIKSINPNANLIVAPAFQRCSNKQFLITQCETGFDFLENQKGMLVFGMASTELPVPEIILKKQTESQISGIFKAAPEFFDGNQTVVADRMNQHLIDSGIYMCRVTHLVDAFCDYLPDLFDLFVCGLSAFNTPYEKLAVRHIYKYCDPVSFTEAILLRYPQVFCLPHNVETYSTHLTKNYLRTEIILKKPNYTDQSIQLAGSRSS